MTDAVYDVVVVGATPGGITAAIAAARGGCRVALLERQHHIGGLPANGLGATDIQTRGAVGGLFLEFVSRIKDHYVQTYGADSRQVRLCSDGYRFEPSVAEHVFEQMLAQHASITVLRRRQFDSHRQHVTMDGQRLTAIDVLDRDSEAYERYEARVFIDATYEGDLAAAAGAPFRVRREGRDEHDEPYAGRVYLRWGGPPGSGAIFEFDEKTGRTVKHDGGVPGEGSTFQGDDTIQAYNYRLCLTNVPDNRVPIERPAAYDRGEYASLVDDVASGFVHGFMTPHWLIPAVVNPCPLPNGKTDCNNHHSAMISTDLPEENWPWPTADWTWRDRFAQRLRDYTLGLLWFCQHDEALPQAFRDKAMQWGLAKNECADNGHFPRQVYVREGRRIEGEHLFTAHDALPVPRTSDGRPPVHRDSITASHYGIDSHAHRKREPDRIGLDGFLTYKTQPYTVPYGVIVPKAVEGLLVPVAVSATHLGFGTLRMEPCWMGLGHAAGVAAALCVRGNTVPRRLDVAVIQAELLRQKAVLLYFKDANPDDPDWATIQQAALRGELTGWHARKD